VHVNRKIPLKKIINFLFENIHAEGLRTVTDKPRLGAGAVTAYFWERILSGTNPARWGKTSLMWGICMACMNCS
jgi:hypothetical protein